MVRGQRGRWQRLREVGAHATQMQRVLRRMPRGRPADAPAVGATAANALHEFQVRGVVLDQAAQVQRPHVQRAHQVQEVLRALPASISPTSASAQPPGRPAVALRPAVAARPPAVATVADAAALTAAADAAATVATGLLRLLVSG